MGGAVYLAVEGVLWLLSASLGAAGFIPPAIIVLFAGGMFIHPVAMGFSKLLGMTTPDKNNRLPILNTWMALTIPLGLPLILMATSSGNQNMFYPAFAILVGAHWLPFTYIYSMKTFLMLAGILVISGILLGFIFTLSFSACGFIVAVVHLLFSGLHYSLVRREIRYT